MGQSIQLESLKNNEIFPYFWSLRATQSPEVLCSFSDLGLLQAQETTEEKSNLADNEWEKHLYGTSEKPVYSGWTLGRLQNVLSKSGFKDLQVKKQSDCRTWASFKPDQPGPWETRRRLHFKGWQKEQQLRNLRKKWRSDVLGWMARASNLLRTADLKKTHKGEVWLNLGAGREEYENYMKVDQAGSQHLYDDITQLTRVSDGSVDRIYSNHVLEHIPIQLIGSMLKRWHSILKPGGTLRVRMPDAKQAVLHLHRTWEETTEERIADLQLPNFLERESVRSGTFDDVSCIQYVYGWSDTNPHGWDGVNQHKSLWTPQLAKKRIEEAGFKVEVSQNLGSVNTVVIAHKI